MDIKLNLPADPFSGQIVTFNAPCDCVSVTNGLSINGEIYTVCDALGKCVTGVGGAWIKGAQVSVVLDCNAKKAYIQNNSNYAPAGYGLGGDTKYLVDTDDLNDITQCGFYSYAYNGIPANGIEITNPFQYVYHVIVSRDANGTIVQNVTTCGASSSDANYHIRRVCGFGGWSPWEYVNPPMIAGVEYRTTERWKGSTVYAKANSDGTISKYLSDGAVVPSGTRVASNLVSSETTPTTENIINWQYE